MAENPAAQGPLTASAALKAAYGLHREGRLAEAQALYRGIPATAPEYFDALNLLGMVAAQQDDFAAALDCFSRASHLRPANPQVHVNVGKALLALGKREEAVASYDRALDWQPGSAELRMNRGIALAELGRLDEALADYDAGLKAAPDDPYLHYNRGNALRMLHRHADALSGFVRARELLPAFHSALKNEALCRLALGDFKEGWRAYETRWNAPGAERRAFTQPLWLGQGGIEGKTVLLHAEQGLGDTIQFSRYAPLVAAKGASVVMEVQRPLRPLVAGIKGVTSVVVRGKKLPPFDYHCPLMSLPLAFGTRAHTVPAKVPYLPVDPRKAAAWRARLPGPGLRVGLAWAGPVAQGAEVQRSIGLRMMGELKGPGVQLVSLQKEFRPVDLELLKGGTLGVRQFDKELVDYSDLAALVSAMDLVIAVDSTAAHLAGALGKPLWLLLSWNADFRWMLDRSDSPWYPSARLFRQRSRGDWKGVIAEVKRTLAQRETAPSP